VYDAVALQANFEKGGSYQGIASAMPPKAANSDGLSR
jgi:hypothetical protein